MTSSSGAASRTKGIDVSDQVYFRLSGLEVAELIFALRDAPREQLDDLSGQIRDGITRRLYAEFVHGRMDLPAVVPDPPPTVTPGPDWMHPAYSVMRRVAWIYRAERDTLQRGAAEAALRAVVRFMKQHSGATASDVDQVARCVSANRCACDRCYRMYSTF